MQTAKLICTVSELFTDVQALKQRQQQPNTSGLIQQALDKSQATLSAATDAIQTMKAITHANTEYQKLHDASKAALMKQVADAIGEVKAIQTDAKKTLSDITLAKKQMADTLSEINKTSAETKSVLGESQKVLAEMKKNVIPKELLDHIQQLELQLQTKATTKKKKPTVATNNNTTPTTPPTPPTPEESAAPKK